MGTNLKHRHGAAEQKVKLAEQIAGNDAMTELCYSGDGIFDAHKHERHCDVLSELNTNLDVTTPGVHVNAPQKRKMHLGEESERETGRGGQGV